MQYWLVGLGGAAGALMRYGISVLTVTLFESDAPVGILICNLLGSFILALLIIRITWLGRWGESVRIAVGVGFLGSFTTFSALSAETLGMLMRGDWIFALLFVTFSFAGGWLAAWLGWTLGQSTNAPTNKGEAKL
jgi:CrcB protein